MNLTELAGETRECCFILASTKWKLYLAPFVLCSLDAPLFADENVYLTYADSTLCLPDVLQGFTNSVYFALSEGNWQFSAALFERILIRDMSKVADTFTFGHLAQSYDLLYQYIMATYEITHWPLHALDTLMLANNPVLTSATPNNYDLQTAILSLAGAVSSVDARTCVNDFLSSLNNAQSGDMESLKLFDAWGKPPPGILDGNRDWLGRTTSCWDIRSFSTHFCVANLSLVRLGVCVPSSCTETVLNELSNTYSHITHDISTTARNIVYRFNNTNNDTSDVSFDCLENQSVESRFANPSNDPVWTAAISVIITLCILIFICTIIDTWF